MACIVVIGAFVGRLLRFLHLAFGADQFDKPAGELGDRPLRFFHSVRSGAAAQWRRRVAPAHFIA